MSLKDQPAFPCAKETIDGPQRTVERFTGMTLRQYAAIKAMQGMLAEGRQWTPGKASLAADAIAHADALLAELEKPAQKGDLK